jgi:zinc/manganese transport system permease protein
MMFDLNRPEWVFLPAMLAGLMVLASHVPLGRQVLLRGIVFLDLAIAQLAAVGALLVQQAFPHAASGWVTAGGLLVALLGAAFLHAMERHAPERQEALIGVVFISVASFTLVLISHDPHGAEQLQTLLGGQILWTQLEDLWPLGLVAILVALLQRFGPNAFQRYFYALFAIAITAAVQVVGVYLVFASLIIPALATLSQTRAAQLQAWGLGALGVLTGLIFSARWDWPAGAAMVLAMVGWSALYWALPIKAPLDQAKTPVER